MNNKNGILSMTVEQLRLEIARAKFGEENVYMRWCWIMPDSASLEEFESEYEPDEQGEYRRLFTPADFAREIETRHWNAQQVPCWRDWFERDDHSRDFFWRIVPDYPRSIAAAWELVEEIGDEIYLHRENNIWQCGQFIDGAGEIFYAEGETAPIVISRAWLLWKEATK